MPLQPSRGAVWDRGRLFLLLLLFVGARAGDFAHEAVYPDADDDGGGGRGFGRSARSLWWSDSVPCSSELFSFLRLTGFRVDAFLAELVDAEYRRRGCATISSMHAVTVGLLQDALGVAPGQFSTHPVRIDESAWYAHLARAAWYARLEAIASALDAAAGRLLPMSPPPRTVAAPHDSPPAAPPPPPSPIPPPAVATPVPVLTPLASPFPAAAVTPTLSLDRGRFPRQGRRWRPASLPLSFCVSPQVSPRPPPPSSPPAARSEAAAPPAAPSRRRRRRGGRRGRRGH